MGFHLTPKNEQLLVEPRPQQGDENVISIYPFKRHHNLSESIYQIKKKRISSSIEINKILRYTPLLKIA